MDLINRLERYTEKALIECTDPDFATAVQEAIDIIREREVEIQHAGFDDAQMGREK